MSLSVGNVGKVKTTNWKRIEIMNGKVRKVGRPRKMLAMAVTEVDETAKVKIGETKSATFSITVSGDDDAVIYSNDKAPFEYQEVSSLADVMKSEGGILGDDQIQFLGEALGGDENGKAVKAVIDLYNRNLKAQAKANAYAKLMNQYKPLSEDDAAKVFERMVDNFVKLYKVSPETARKSLAAMQPTA